MKTMYVIETLSVVFGFLSIIILATQGNILSFHITNIKAIGWGLLTGASYGFFSAYSSIVPKEKQSIFLLSSIFSSLVAMLITSFYESSLFLTLTLKDILIVGLLGCVVDGLGYIAWTRANRLARETNINILSLASMTFALPIVSLIVITIFLGETKLWQPYFGVALLFVLISSLLSQKANTIGSDVKNKKE